MAASFFDIVKRQIKQLQISQNAEFPCLLIAEPALIMHILYVAATGLVLVSPRLHEFFQRRSAFCYCYINRYRFLLFILAVDSHGDADQFSQA